MADHPAPALLLSVQQTDVLTTWSRSRALPPADQILASAEPKAIAGPVHSWRGLRSRCASG
ncbi:MAG: hypothetical protein ACYDCS_12350 [Candidatus Dormibacteria bacterium]